MVLTYSLIFFGFFFILISSFFFLFRFVHSGVFHPSSPLLGGLMIFKVRVFELVLCDLQPSVAQSVLGGLPCPLVLLDLQLERHDLVELTGI